MLALYCKIMSYLKSDEGQGMAEYGLILALIAAVVIAALTVLGTSISTLFSGLSGKIVMPGGS
jgi:pilus assembly protein Flp/PilA